MSMVLVAFWTLFLIFPYTKTYAKSENLKLHLQSQAKKTSDMDIDPPLEVTESLEFDLVFTGGYLEIKGQFYADQAKVHSYSNLNHGIGIYAYLPEKFLLSPFGMSLYLQGKYMTFGESVDKKLGSTKFVDIDYGIRGTAVEVQKVRLDLDLGLQSNPILIRRPNRDFKIINVPSPIIGTKFSYSTSLSKLWSLTVYAKQHLLGAALASGVRVREGVGYGFGCHFNIDLDHMGYAYIGFDAKNESQNTEQGSQNRVEDLVLFGFSFALDEAPQDTQTHNF